MYLSKSLQIIKALPFLWLTRKNPTRHWFLNFNFFVFLELRRLRSRGGGDAVCDARDQEEHGECVDQGEHLTVLGVRGHVAEEAAHPERDVAHRRGRGKQNDTEQVEKQVAQRDLHGFHRVARRHRGAHDTGQRGADVRP